MVRIYLHEFCELLDELDRAGCFSCGGISCGHGEAPRTDFGGSPGTRRVASAVLWAWWHLCSLLVALHLRWAHRVLWWTPPAL